MWIINSFPSKWKFLNKINLTEDLTVNNHFYYSKNIKVTFMLKYNKNAFQEKRRANF